jgi:predicted chitinase
MNTDRLVPKLNLNAKQFVNINLLVTEAKAQGITDDRQIAYILATAKHETAGTFAPIKEYGGITYFIKKYWLNSRVAKWLGNDNANDAAKYFGRGFVQITGETNYERFAKLFNIDLVNNPDLALVPAIAAKIAVYGMIHGTFTGAKLADYFRASANPISARRIINGTDKAELIAKYYNEILGAL